MSSADYEKENDNSDDASSAFIDLVGDDIKPLSGKVSAHLGKPALITPGVLERRKAAQREIVAELNELDPVMVIEQVDPLTYLEFQRPGVQHGVYKNLRMGKYEIQSRLIYIGTRLNRHAWHFGGLLMIAISTVFVVR